MKYFLISILSFLVHSGSCQEQKIKKVVFEGKEYFLYPDKQSTRFSNHLTVWIENNIRKRYSLSQNDIIDGNWIQFYEEDTTMPAKIFTLKNKKIEGEYIKRYIDGQNESIDSYESGKENGISKYWYENGQLKDSIIYKNNPKEYYSQLIYKKAFYENGVIKKVELYDTNAVRNGVWTEYYENGQVKIKQEFSNKIHLTSLLGMHYFVNITGEYLYYYENGQLRFKLNFDKGEMIDEIFCEYYENGNKKQYGQLVKGLRDGEWVELYENSNLKAKGSYLSSSFRACGRMPYTSYYEYKTGLWEYYYVDNNLLAKGIYNNEVTNINSGCGPTNVNCGTFTKSWLFKDVDGNGLKEKNVKKQSLLKNKEVIHQRVYRPERF